MISAINITGSHIPYQMQTFTANELTATASTTKSASESDSGDYKISLNTQLNRLGYEQNNRQEELKQQHESDSRQLDKEYSRQQQQIEQEYRIKKNTLKISVYA